MRPAAIQKQAKPLTEDESILCVSMMDRIKKVEDHDNPNKIKVVAVIPARGGSKRIPHKNIKDFKGKPLIVWMIEKCKEIEEIDEVIVSTEPLPAYRFTF